MSAKNPSTTNDGGNDAEDGGVIGQCALCDAKETNLRESHSIPKFVFQWLKDTSKTPYIRSSDDVNIRHQDGPKEYLLCGTCEGDLAVLEKELAEQLFRKVANYRQQRSLISVTEAMRVAVLSIFWRALLTTKHRDSDRTAEDKHSLDLFLDSIKAEIRLGRCNTKIYIAPFYGSPPYYGFPKAMTYKLERSIGSQDIRFFDDPHRFFAAFKLPFMYFYIFGDGWTEKDLKNSTELIVGQLMVDEIKEIPSMLRSYIEYQYREYLKSLTQMDEKNLDQVKADAAKNKNITGSDKSKSRSDS